MTHALQTSNVFAKNDLVEVELTVSEDPRRGRLLVLDSFGVTLVTTRPTMGAVAAEKRTMYPWSAIVSVAKVSA